MPRRNPASKEPPENSLAIVSFQMIAGGEPLRGHQFLLLRFNRGAYTERGRPSGDIRTVLESTDTVSFHEKVPPSPAGGLFAFAFDTPIKTFAFFSEERP